MPVYNYRWLDPNKDPAPVGLLAHGPTLQVEVHVPTVLASAIAQQGGAIPAPGVGIGIIDTGATFSAVHKDIVTALGLNPIRTTTVGTAQGQVQQSVYMVRLAVPAMNLDFDASPLAAVDLTGQLADGQPVIALIGRDLLRQCVFIYNGPLGVFTLSW